MKIFAVIMSIFITVLATMPCTDARAEIHKPQQEHKDSCTPFCGCACCGVHGVNVFFQIPEAEFPVSVNFDKKTVIYTFHIFSNFFQSIWQPPKL